MRSLRENKPHPPKAPDAAYLERAALYYLERFSASSAQLKKVLLRKIMRRAKARGEPAEQYYAAIEPLLARYQASGLLNDQLYAEAQVTSLKRRGKSKRMIQAKLAQKGVGRELVQQSLDANHISEIDAAREFVRRKKLGQVPEKSNKDLATLARAGFSYAIAKEALESICD